MRSAAAPALLALALACAREEPEGPGPRFDELVPGEVNVIRPGGDTICSRGGEYAFFVIPGARDKVIIEFEGGGACWDEQTCKIASNLFREGVDVEAHMGSLGELAGWYNHGHPDHPMPDWTHVFIPYCTGDIHWGDNVKSYGADAEAFSIHHKGAVNVTAALAWVYGQLRNPAKAFVTGCSAGGYGSIWWAPHIQKRYPRAKVYQFADSAAGVITDDFFQRSFPSWNVEPSWASFLGPFSAATGLAVVYRLNAEHFRTAAFSQYNTLLDANQALYYIVMGGKDREEWSQKMKASLADIQSAAPNFRSYLAGGEQHCILPAPNFFEAQAGGTRLTDWLARLVADAPVQSVSCPECMDP